MCIKTCSREMGVYNLFQFLAAVKQLQKSACLLCVSVFVCQCVSQLVCHKRLFTFGYVARDAYCHTCQRERCHAHVDIDTKHAQIHVDLYYWVGKEQLRMFCYNKLTSQAKLHFQQDAIYLFANFFRFENKQTNKQTKQQIKSGTSK